MANRPQGEGLEGLQLLRFAGRAIREAHSAPFIGDWDGGDVQQALLDCGLLEEREVRESCGDHCECEVGQRCNFLTPLGENALASIHPEAGETNDR